MQINHALKSNLYNIVILTAYIINCCQTAGRTETVLLLSPILLSSVYCRPAVRRSNMTAQHRIVYDTM
jgi:hypothetical protein